MRSEAEQARGLEALRAALEEEGLGRFDLEHQLGDVVVLRLTGRLEVAYAVGGYDVWDGARGPIALQHPPRAGATACPVGMTVS